MKNKLNPNEVLQHGINLLLNNRSEELKNLFKACIQQAPSNETGWILKAAYNSAISELEKVFDVIDDASKFGLNKIILAGKIGHFFLDFKDYVNLIKLKEKAINRQDYPIWVYFSGCSYMMTEDENSAFECFDNFIPLLLPLVQKKGIQILIHYKKPLFKQKALYSNSVRIINAFKIANNTISLPIYPHLNNRDIKKIYRELNKYA